MNAADLQEMIKRGNREGIKSSLDNFQRHIESFLRFYGSNQCVRNLAIIANYCIKNIKYFSYKKRGKFVEVCIYTELLQTVMEQLFIFDLKN